jgi:uncharacterized SAM-binding protein YcdF (DUF218 family)
MIASLLLFFSRRVLSFLCLLTGSVLLYLSSIPLVSNYLLQSLETYPALDQEEISQPRASAIVILGGGHYPDAPEYDGDTVSQHTLVRIRYGAWLHRHTGLPILLTGGTVGSAKVSEARLMQLALDEDFQIKNTWIEGKSSNTLENAAFSQKVLSRKGIKKIYLVTHAWHMNRSLIAFQQSGLDVIPAPTGFTTNDYLSYGIFSLLPRSRSLFDTNRALHEYLGESWYRFKKTTL